MAFLTYFLMTTFILSFIGAIIALYIEYKNSQTPKSVGKLVENLIYHISDGQIYGNLVKKTPVGKKKELIRIEYNSRVMNDENEPEIKTFYVITNKHNIIETDNKLSILPFHSHEIDNNIPYYNEIKLLTDKIRDTKTVVNAMEISYTNMSDLINKSRHGEYSQEELNKLMDIQMAMKEQKEQEEKKGENT